MNDFTKQELQWLHNHLSLPIEYPDGGWEGIEDIQFTIVDKIKKMIAEFDMPCKHPNCRRLSLLNGHDYDICPDCEYIMRMR